jgi:hypothetical protein
MVMFIILKFKIAIKIFKIKFKDFISNFNMKCFPKITIILTNLNFYNFKIKAQKQRLNKIKYLLKIPL